MIEALAGHHRFDVGGDHSELPTPFSIASARIRGNGDQTMAVLGRDTKIGMFLDNQPAHNYSCFRLDEINYKDLMMASERKVANPLALAVMALLYERPMHAYEMISLMRERRKHESVRLKYSSLYSVVGVLEREALISQLETVREGRRPERTVYELTEAGRIEFLTWLRELIGEPMKEYTQFAAGLSFLPALPPQEAADLLQERVGYLEEEVGSMRTEMKEVLEQGLPRLFLVEHEHELVLKEAELEWIRSLANEIADETLGGIQEWKDVHSQPVTPGVGEKEEAP